MIHVHFLIIAVVQPFMVLLFNGHSIYDHLMQNPLDNLGPIGDNPPEAEEEGQMPIGDNPPEAEEMEVEEEDHLCRGGGVAEWAIVKPLLKPKHLRQLVDSFPPPCVLPGGSQDSAFVLPGGAQEERYGFMAPRWHERTIAPRALKKNNKIFFGKCPKVNHCF